MNIKILMSIIIIFLITGFIFVILGFSFHQTIFSHWFIIIDICVLLGVTIKIMDQLIDDITMKSYRLWIIPIAVFIPGSMVYLALTEGPVIGMVIGTVIGLIIAGKIDHPAYVASIILFIVLIFFAFILHIIRIEATTFYIIPVAAVGSFLDEFGHERWRSSNKSITFMFQHRFFLKTFAFFGVIFGFALPIHFIGFLCFDICYDLVDTTSRSDAKCNKFIPARLSSSGMK
jgi:hypothetical protein